MKIFGIILLSFSSAEYAPWPRFTGLMKNRKELLKPDNIKHSLKSSETIQCYSCEYVVDMMTGVVYVSPKECETDVGSKPEFLLTVPKEETITLMDNTVIKMKNACAYMNYNMTETVQYTDNEGQIHNDITNLHTFSREIWPLFETSTMWDFEGVATMSDYTYGCGMNVSVCSEAFSKDSPDPADLDPTDSYQPCTGCNFVRVRNAATGDLSTMTGNAGCMNAVPSLEPTCTIATGPMTFYDDSGDSGICFVGEVSLAAKKGGEVDEILQYRFCDQNDTFLDSGYLSMNYTDANLNICQTSLCNSDVMGLSSVILLFFAIILV